MLISEVELASIEAAWIRADPLASGGVITDINYKGAELFGYKPVELIGQPISVLIPEQNRQRQSDAFDRAVLQEHYKPFSFEVEALCRDGTTIRVWHKIGIYQESIGPKRFVALIFPIEETKIG